MRVLPVSRRHSACCRLPTSMSVDPALSALWPQDKGSGLHGPSQPDMDFRPRVSSNFLSNIMLETGTTDFVEDLVRLQAEAAGDDFLLDLGGPAEDRLDAGAGSDVIRPSSHRRPPPGCGRAGSSVPRPVSVTAASPRAWFPASGRPTPPRRAAAGGASPAARDAVCEGERR